jgi:hypothetical protein
MEIENIIEYSVDLRNSNHTNLFTWFMLNDHVKVNRFSTDIGLEYKNKYDIFLKELYNLYHKTNDEYYWFVDGRLVSDGGSDIIAENSIRIDKSRMREIKINQLVD